MYLKQVLEFSQVLDLQPHLYSFELICGNYFFFVRAFYWWQ